MKFFTQLFDSSWRQNGDELSKARQNKQYGSMPEQVMATRNEVLHLQGELDRLSQDLAQTMTLNRVLIKLLVAEGVCTPETLELLLSETLQQSEVALGENETSSRFCENCGRPLAQRGRTCPYCTELHFEEASHPASEVSAQGQDSPNEQDAEIPKETAAASKDKSTPPGRKKKKRSRSSKES